MKFLLEIFSNALQYFFMIATAGDRIHVVIYSESDLFSVCFPAFKNPMQSTSCRPLFWIWRHTKSGRDKPKLMVVIPITSDLSLPLALFYDLDILCCFFSVYFSFLPDGLSFCLIYKNIILDFCEKFFKRQSSSFFRPIHYYL